MKKKNPLKVFIIMKSKTERISKFYGKIFGQIFPIFFMKPAAGAKFLHWLGDKLQIPPPKIAHSSKRHFRHSV